MEMFDSCSISCCKFRPHLLWDVATISSKLKPGKIQSRFQRHESADGVMPHKLNYDGAYRLSKGMLCVCGPVGSLVEKYLS